MKMKNNSELDENNKEIEPKEKKKSIDIKVFNEYGYRNFKG